jgi:hypothetical protein
MRLRARASACAFLGLGPSGNDAKHRHLITSEEAGAVRYRDLTVVQDSQPLADCGRELTRIVL